MTPSQKSLFDTLKKEVAAIFLKENHAPDSISDWKGEQITAFQEDLFQKTKEKVSEKWFYTHVKNDPEKLPRIDMLNLLSRYIGYENWEAFAQEHTETSFATKAKSRRYLWLLLPVIPLVLALYILNDQTNEFRFCMIDEDQNLPITETQINIKILTVGQSPIYLKTDTNGCFSYETEASVIRFVVQSPYHKTDTITRHIDSHSNATVKLTTDDYALMLRYYSSGNVAEIEKRRAHLDNLIAPDAEIYRVFPQQTGIELYSKDEFINKLTIPTSSLKNINILDKKYQGGKIVKLKFSVQ